MRVHSIVFNFARENTYIIYNENKNCIIIDPGCSNVEEQNQLTTFIEKNNLTPKLLLLTHLHIDHIFGLDFVAKKYNLIPHWNERDNYFLKIFERYAEYMDLNVTKKYTGTNINIDENSDLIFDDTKIKILATPGHSPGSLVYVFDKFIINGDVLFRDGIGRTDLPLCNYEDLKKSIQQKLYKLNDDIIVYTGHGFTTTIGYEKNNNPFINNSNSV